MEKIFFHSEDIIFDHHHKIKTKLWVAKIIINEIKLVGEINFIFCSDNYLHSLNIQHLNHDTLTDIITFDYVENGIISGDIFISIERVKENALVFNVPFYEELNRVVAHGVLHLLGYKDKKNSEKLEMREKEQNALNLFETL